MTAARRTLVATLVILVTAVTVGAVRIGEFLSGGGLQPTALMPADVVAAVNIDLDPALDQKLAIRAIATHFPSTKHASDDDLRLDGLQAILPTCLNAEDDISSWIGFRIGIAVPAGSTSGVPVGVVQIRNGKVHTARRAADRISTCLHGKARLAIRDHYLLISSSQQLLERMLSLPRSQSLHKSAVYRGDIASLQGNQIATVWGDGTRAKSLLDLLADRLPEVRPVADLLPHVKGRAVIGIHATHSLLEVRLSSIGGAALSKPGVDAATSLLEKADAKSMAAVYVQPSLAGPVQQLIKQRVPGLVLGGGSFLTRLVGLPTINLRSGADGSLLVSVGPTKAEDAGLRAKALASVPGPPVVVAFLRPSTIPGAPKSIDPVKAIGLVVTQAGDAALRVVV